MYSSHSHRLSGRDKGVHLLLALPLGLISLARETAASEHDSSELAHRRSPSSTQVR